MIQSEQNLTITRVFTAPRELVWRAFTEPEFFMQWWGMEGFTSPIAEIDLRVGRKRLNCMRSPEGKDIWTAGVYREVLVPGWLVYTDSFVDTERNVVPASYYGMSFDWPLETLITVMFQERDGETVVTLSYAGVPPGRSRQEIQAVWNQSFDTLTTILHEKNQSKEK